MKKVLFIILSAILLVACSNDGAKEAEAEVDVEKKEEMTDNEFVIHLNKAVKHLALAYMEEEGSFEWKSELQAASKQSDSLVEEIKEGYEDVPEVDIIVEYAERTKEAAEISLGGKESFAGLELTLIYDDIEEIVKEQTDGEDMPPSLKMFNEYRLKINK